jgi:phage RecT family recombinase
MTSTDLVVASKPLGALISTNQAALESALTGKPLVLAEFAAALDNAVAQDEKLAECVVKNPDSIKNAILTAAMLGLRPGPVHRHFALTCFKVKGKPTCVGIPEWRGLIEVANQAGALDTSIVCDVIYEHEVKDKLFGYDRLTGEVSHEEDLLDEHAEKRTPDKLVAVYATCRVKDRQGFATVVLRKKEVEKRRESSAAWRFKGKDSLWGTNTVAMWRKTAIRALLESGKVPMSRNVLAEMNGAERQADKVLEAEVIKPADVIEKPSPAAPAETEKERPEDVTVTGQKIVNQERPPADKSVIWRRSSTGNTYEHDGGNWVPCEVL